VPRPPSISESEWLVADVLWAEPGLTAVEVAERLPHSGWKQKTVNTFLARLVSKGVLTAKREGRAFRYSPRIPRERCVKAEADSFLKRVFRGATAPLLMHFCETAPLSEDEIVRLRQILDDRSRNQPGARKGGR